VFLPLPTPDHPGCLQRGPIEEHPPTAGVGVLDRGVVHHSVAVNSESIARAVVNIVLPVSCVGCGEPDTQWCSHCAATSTRHHQPTLAWRQALWGTPVWSVADYEGTWQRAVVSWKDRGASRLATPLGHLMAQVLERLNFSSDRLVVLVPVPSSLGGWVARGVQPTLALAQATAYAWNGTHQGVANGSSRTESSSGQVFPRVIVGQGLRRGGGLSLFGQFFSRPHRRKRRSRSTRLGKPSRFVAKRWLRGHRVVLIDDVLTTGSTLEQAASAVRRAGGQLVGCVVFAAKPL